MLMHTEHNLWERYQPITRWANALTYGRNVSVIGVSQAVVDSIRPPRLMPHSPPVTLIRHGPNVEAIGRGEDARARARAELSLTADELVVGTVGNFTAKKNQRMLLDAVAGIQAIRDVRIVLIGVGPLQEELEAHAKALGLGNRVTFTGLRGDVYSLLAGFDVFALSSDFEGLPIALLEAMAARLPCVATAVGGIPEVISDTEQGFLVAPGDTLMFTDRLEKLLTDPALRSAMAQSALRRASEFDLRRAVAQTQEMYDEAVAG